MRYPVCDPGARLTRAYRDDMSAASLDIETSAETSTRLAPDGVVRLAASTMAATSAMELTLPRTETRPASIAVLDMLGEHRDEGFEYLFGSQRGPASWRSLRPTAADQRALDALIEQLGTHAGLMSAIGVLIEHRALLTRAPLLGELLEKTVAEMVAIERDSGRVGLLAGLRARLCGIDDSITSAQMRDSVCGELGPTLRDGLLSTLKEKPLQASASARSQSFRPEHALAMTVWTLTTDNAFAGLLAATCAEHSGLRLKLIRARQAEFLHTDLLEANIQNPDELLDAELATTKLWRAVLREGNAGTALGNHRELCTPEELVASVSMPVFSVASQLAHRIKLAARTRSV